MKYLFLILSISILSTNSTICQSDWSIPFSVAYVSYDVDGHGTMISTEKMLGQKYVAEAALTSNILDDEEQSLSFTGFVSRRMSYDNGFSPQFGLGLGVITTWDDSEDGTATIDVDSEEAQTAMTAAIKVSPLGWDFRTKEEVPVRLFFDCVLYATIPKLKEANPHVLFQLGGTYYFNYQQSATKTND